MLEVIILAAGQGSRMQSSLPKVLHTLAGQPLVGHVLQTARALNAERIHVVVGHGAEVLSNAILGPYARLRPGTVIGEQAKVGNFVEVKNTRVGKAAKANHLAYLGDADIGSQSNVGAGTITCNYDGANKHRTTLGEGVFVGSNSTLVAPLVIESGGFVAAGSTVTDDVKADQLAVARGRQRNVDGRQRPEKPGDSD